MENAKAERVGQNTVGTDGSKWRSRKRFSVNTGEYLCEEKGTPKNRYCVDRWVAGLVRISPSFIGCARPSFTKCDRRRK